MARSTSRFNKLLNFIGLVDDEPEEELTQERMRPAGAQTYNPAPRRAQNAAPVRPVRSSQGYEDVRAPRYGASAGRGDYAAPRSGASMGRADYAPDGYSRSAYRAQASDYARSDYTRSDYTRSDYSRSDYGRGASDYGQVTDYGRASARTDYDRGASRAREADFYAGSTQRASTMRDFAPSASAPRNNVVSMRAAESRHQTVIYYLHELEECRDVIGDLLESKTVLLNLEDMDERLIQRAIDTLCGAAFALGATLRKASDKTYLIAPNNVSVALTNENERY